MSYKDKEIGRVKKREYYCKNIEILKIKQKKYYFKNRDARLAYQKKRYPLIKEKVSVYHKKYIKLNKQKIADYRKRYRKEHYQDVIVPYKQRVRKNINATMRKYRANRIKIDPQYRISINLRNRLLSAMKKNSKTGSAIRDLGCTIPELKLHLEKQFREGMTWDNYGRKGWQIDHIKQLKEFDLTNRQQFLEAVHYINLQPLWWYENLAKRFI